MKEDKLKKEISYIKNDKYKESAKILINLLPDYFFEVAASSTGKYHPSFALGEGGLLRHTKAAVRIAYELLTDDAIGNIFTNDEKDLMIIALIMHDGLKHGLKEEKYTKFEHPILMADFIKENSNLLSLNKKEIDFLIEVISSHMGPWNTNSYSNVTLPVPENKYQKFVHMCDFLASRKFLDITFKNDDIDS